MLGELHLSSGTSRASIHLAGVVVHNCVPGGIKEQSCGKAYVSIALSHRPGKE